MNKNINSPTKLTEFAPLSPQDGQPGVASFLSKFFNFTRNASGGDGTVTSSHQDEQSCSSGDSESWKGNKHDRNEATMDYDRSTIISTYAVDSSEGRSLPNVLKRISNIVAVKSNNLKSYKDSHLRSYWMPDKKAKQCYECGERFTTFRRRHHCRVCGQIFCSKCCSDEIPGKIMGCTGDLRVCTYCCKVVLSYLQSSDMKSVLSADLKALQEDLLIKYGNDSLPIMENMSGNSAQNDTRISRKSSVGYMEEKYAIGTSTDYLSSQERSSVLHNSTSLRIICEELFRSNQAINLQTHRIRLKNYYNCFTGHELVTWMISRNKAATRIQAEAVGQALFEANYIESVQCDVGFSDSQAIFRPTSNNLSVNYLSISSKSSCDGQEPAWVKNIPQHDSTTDSESETKPYTSPQYISNFPASGSSFYLDLNLEDSTVMLKRPTSQKTDKEFSDISDSVSDSKTDFNSASNHALPDINNVSIGLDELMNDDPLQTVQRIKEVNYWHDVNNLRNSFGEMSAHSRLSSSYKQHEDALIRQLLNSQGLSQKWSEVIIPLAHQIVDQVRPDKNHDADDMDIRQYVQIKKLPGGIKHHSEIVSGVVCSKNIAHRSMHSTILNPKILLLQCGLMYQRVEGKLLSLEPVMLQEKEYLGYTVARIMALRPNIVMVHRSVSRLAQDKFRECGVTLVLNVKLPVLERVARCTGATIVNTIDAQLTTRFKLGTCQKFSLKNFTFNDNSIKTLMCFEGCVNDHLGSTILLRGGSLVELKKVKSVMSTMISGIYSRRLEISFLMDEFAIPPLQKNDFLNESSSKESITRLNSDSNNDTLKSATKTSTEDNKVDSNSNINIFENLNNNGIESNSYDTLKLFKQTPKVLNDNKDEKLRQEKELNLWNTNCNDINNAGDISTGSGCFYQSNSSNSTQINFSSKLEKVLSEEKRVYGESVSDQSDPLHQYLNEENIDIFSQSSTSNASQKLSLSEIPLLNKFKKALDDTILSFSPYLKFTIPYLETEQGRNCILRKEFFPEEIFFSAQLSNNKLEGTRCIGTNHVINLPASDRLRHKLKPPHSFTLMKFTSNADSKQVQTLLADFRARGSQFHLTNNVILEKISKTLEHETIATNESVGLSRWPDCLDPASHLRLPVLFCTFSHNANNVPSFCLNPWIVNMDLYGRNDIALGRFLERYCLTSEYKCPATSCRSVIDQHDRRFAHDGGCIHISLKKMTADPFGQEGQHILMWSKCVICKNVSPVVPISPDTWSLSFAKYLELRFHGNVYINRSSDTCQHSLHHDHYQYFSKGNMLAVFKYTKILLWEISLPPPLIHVIYDVKQHANVIEEVKNIALKGDEVFSNIKEKLVTLQIDQDGLNSIKQQVNKEQQYFKNKIEEIQLKLTSPTLDNKKLEGKTSERHVQSFMFRIEDGIVILKRLISETVSNWNVRILDLATKKKEERHRRFTERTPPTGNSGIIDADGYITEDTASESLIEDLSPISADYNVVDVISKVQSDFQLGETLESSDNEVQESINQTDIVVLQDSPKSHQRSYSDVLPITLDDIPDRKKKKKTILSQLLPSAPIITPILNPLGALEHHLLPIGTVVPIVVYELEPSSIIAYALDSHEYKHALQEINRTTKVADQNSSPLHKRKLDNKDNSADSSHSDNNLHNNGSSVDTDEDKRAIKQQNYIEVQFADDTANFYCRIYFAAQFASFRENVLPCGECGFTRSLCRSVQWAARGGKSGSAFCKSRDDRFILKELSRVEMQIFLDFAPNYFSYMEKCQQSKQPTLLGKIVGVYRVSFKNNTTNASLKTSVLVMENLFYSRAITDKYDLKGSVRNRLVNPEEADHEGELVLLDENLLNMSCDSPLYIRPHSKDVLNKAIEQDTKFLAENSVMDYSLLVGLEPDSNQLVLGIIDYIRTFTWDKKLETMVKKSGILGGQGKLPTIVSPEEYRARFIVAMHRYFLPVPDRWTGLGRGVETG